jgi:hypothetical protein
VIAPNNAEIASHFLADTTDYLARVHLTRDEFGGMKSRRLKWFMDIRLAYECALKAAIAESMRDAEDGERLLKEIEGYGHRIGQLERDAFPVLLEGLRPFGAELDRLPVGLRYRIDCWDFISSRGRDYYETAGDDTWRESLLGQTRVIVQHVSEKLNKYSRILSGDELWDALENARPSKHRKK